MEKEEESKDLEYVAQKYLQDPTPENAAGVVEAGKGLVLHFARQFTYGTPSDDHVQAGYEGLLKALSRYDHERSARFTTYASHWIMGEIRAEIRRQKRFDRQGWIIELQGRIVEYMEETYKRKGKFPTTREISEHMNIAEEGIIQALQATSVSFDKLDLSQVRSIRPQPFRLPIEDKIVLFQAMKSLSTIQRKVFYFLFFKDMTQAETAQELKTNQRKISRLKQSGIEEIKKKLEE